jgi:aminopeptidase N
MALLQNWNRMKRSMPMAGLAAMAILTAASLATAQRLPRTAVPDHYDLTFTPDLQKARFAGDEIIQVEVPAPTRSITLNALDLDFQSADMASGGVTEQARVTMDGEKQMATLSVERPLPAGTAQIHIRFTGILNDKLRGFYLARSGGRRYAVTQFESTDARRAFPCFDEPAYKATFSITLVVDRGDTAISNGKLASDKPGPADGKHTLTFGVTPKMSSYLVAMAVGDFQCVNGAAEGTPIRVCATPDKKAMGLYALEAAEHVLQYYDQYFAIRYPFGKLDLVAAPDFEAGAMENTACIIFRESLLLLDSQHASPEARRSVAGVIAHEMAHQWFGDLVTMRWWDDIWLNEGFATWMSSKPLEAWHPEWNIGVSQASATGGALDADSLDTTRPIHARSAETPDEIDQLFDGIAYGKTAAVLRMLESYEGPETFRAGVNAYLAQHAYGNSTAADFWDAQTQASKLPIDRIMPTFVNQPGAPLVNLSVSCQGDAEQLTLSQQRYFSDRAAFEKGTSELWQLPVCLKWPDGKGGFTTRCLLLTEKRKTIPVQGCAPWMFGNEGAHGYYRSGYDEANLRALAEHAETGLTPPERIALVNDAWALVRIGKDSIVDFMGLSEDLRSDPSPDVEQRVLAQFNEIGDRLLAEADRPAFAVWLRSWLKPEAEKLGWQAAPDESGEKRSLRAVVLGVLGQAGRDPETLDEARRQAERYLADPSSVDPALAGVALRLAALNGDARLYDEIVAAQGQAGRSPEYYARCFSALAAFRDPALLRRTLNYALSSDVRSQDFVGLIDAVMNNPSGRDLAWGFVKTHWGEIQKKASYGGLAGVVFATGAFCDPQHRADVSDFFSSHPVREADRAIPQALEDIQGCIDLRAQQGQNLAAWLEKQGSTSQTASRLDRVESLR